MMPTVKIKVGLRGWKIDKITIPLCLFHNAGASHRIIRTDPPTGKRYESELGVHLAELVSYSITIGVCHH